MPSRSHLLLVAIAWLALVSACAAPANTLALPEGTAQRGKDTFMELRCYSCHEVKGFPELPKPSTSKPTGVALGEMWTTKIADTKMVNSIINPDHEIDPVYDRAMVTTAGGKESRMADYADLMTVRQLADLVAFLREVNDTALK